MAYLRDRIKKSEGLSLQPYVDTLGNLTIGWGHKLSGGRGIPLEVAELLLDLDIAEKDRECRKTFEWYDKLDPLRQWVILEMAFNLGTAGVAKFSKMIEAIKHQEWDLASQEMLKSQWSSQVGLRAQRLACELKEGIECPV